MGEEILGSACPRFAKWLLRKTYFFFFPPEKIKMVYSTNIILVDAIDSSYSFEYDVPVACEYMLMSKHMGIATQSLQNDPLRPKKTGIFFFFSLFV